MSETVTCHDMEGNEYEVANTDLRWRPSAYAIVLRSDSILVSRQFGGLTLPGGGVELGELPEDAVIRETYEETGITVAEPQVVGLRSTFFKLPESHKGLYVQSIMMYYICKFIGGELSIEQFDEYDKTYTGEPLWMPLAELPGITVGGTVDWREFVMKAQHENFGD